MFSLPAPIHGGYLPLAQSKRDCLGAIEPSMKLISRLGKGVNQLPVRRGLHEAMRRNLPRAIATPTGDVLKEIPGDMGEEMWSVDDASKSVLQPQKKETSIISSTGELSFGRLMQFVLPSCGLWVITPVLSLVDTAVVGTRSSVELAALGPGVMMLDALTYLCMFLGVTVTNRASLTLSKKNNEATGKVVSDALVMGAALGVACMLGLWLACPTILKSMAGQASAEIVGPAVSYVHARAIGMPAVMVTQVIQSYFLAAHDPYTPLLALLLAACLNFLGDMLLVVGMGMGITGAAVATAVAQVVTALVLIKAASSPLPKHSIIPGFRIPLLWKWPAWQSIVEFLKIGGPVFGSLLVKISMYSILTSMATGLSPAHCGAHHIAMSLFLLFCFVGDALATAAEAFLPSFIGKPKIAWKLSLTLQWSSIAMACLVGLGAGVVLFTSPFLFTESTAVAAALIEIVPYFALVMFFQCSSMVTEGLLLAGRDASYLLCSNVLNIGAGLLVALALRGMGSGLPALWWCILQFQFSRSFLNWGRMVMPNSILNRSKSLSEN